MAAQRWMAQRFEGLQPTDFGEGVRMHCVASLHPPPGFEDVWTVALSSSEPPIHQTVMSGAVVLLFGDLRDEAQAALVRHFVTAVDDAGPQAPPVIYVHHAADSESKAGCNETKAGSCSLEESVLEQHTFGLDAAILEPCEGLRLALHVRASICSIAQMCASASAILEEQRAMSLKASKLRGAIRELTWNYTSRRLAQQSLPVEDASIGSGIPRTLAGYTLGRQLGSGSCGTVFQLVGTGSPCVVKAIEKQRIQDIEGLLCVIQSITVQQTLSGGKWRHPNVGQLLQVHHSPTHVLLRLENAGAQNLHSRLSKQRFSVAKAASAMRQAAAAVAHLHLGPGICHRDVKPENFVVEEGSHGVRIKLVDLDMAFFPRPGVCSTSHCGTLPFTAPEIFLAESHLPLPTDLWSLGVVMLEVTCGVGFLTHALGIKLPREPKRGDCFRFCQQVQLFFSEPGTTSRALNEAAHHGLGELLPRSGQLLDALLEVDVPRRWKAQQVSQAIAAGLLEEHDPHA